MQCFGVSKNHKMAIILCVAQPKKINTGCPKNVTLDKTGGENCMNEQASFFLIRR